MGIMRTFGLFFFMTILIGGCILATGDTSPPDPVDFTTQAVSWQEAQDLIQKGRAASVSQAPNLMVTIMLPDGTRLITRAPAPSALKDVIVTCGQPCSILEALNL